MKIHETGHYERKILALKKGKDILEILKGEGGEIPPSLSVFRRWGAVVLPIEGKYLLLTKTGEGRIYFTIAEYLNVNIPRRIPDGILLGIIKKIRDIINSS